MPTLGNIKFAYEIGKHSGENDRQKYIWDKCSVCGNERWAYVSHGKAKYTRCYYCSRHCSRNLSPRGTLAKGTIANPVKGDIRFGDEIGEERSHKYIFEPCPDCGKSRWLQYHPSVKSHYETRCPRCSQLHRGIRPKKITRGSTAKGTIEEPLEGDVRFSDELGIKEPCKKFMWRICIHCKNPIGWVRIRADHPETKYCSHCRHSGVRSHLWKGKSYFNSHGYKLIYVTSDNPFFSMATYKNSSDGGYIFEHRLAMARHLNRPLQKWEVVHHKNHIKTDNRIENLTVFATEHHQGITILENKIANLSKQVSTLNAKIAIQDKTIALLFWHISEINNAEATNVTSK